MAGLHFKATGFFHNEECCISGVVGFINENDLKRLGIYEDLNGKYNYKKTHQFLSARSNFRQFFFST